MTSAPQVPAGSLRTHKTWSPSEVAAFADWLDEQLLELEWQHRSYWTNFSLAGSLSR